jgi:hypothetical protein
MDQSTLLNDTQRGEAGQFVQNKSSGNGERYPHHTTASPCIPHSCTTICHHLLREVYTVADCATGDV